MAIDIGRTGWVGLGFETTPGSPVAIVDYAPFTENTLKGMQESIKNEAAYGVREKVFSTVVGKKWAEGDVSINLDGKMSGYFLGAALGTVNSANVAGSVYDHTITRKANSTAKTLTVVNDRVVDRQYVPFVAVSQAELTVSDGLATLKSTLMGRFPITTTSGSLTTASGGLFTFIDNSFAFSATSPADALNQANLKPHDMKLTINNNSSVLHRHGNADADTINHGEFEVTGEGTIYFENTTQRDVYYANTKRSAAMRFLGRGIGGGYQETLTVNLYQVSLDSYELETGLADFYQEKFNLLAEYDNANTKSIDMVLRNTKSSY